MVARATQLKRDINSQELENFLLRDNIYIEWVRIREFNGSGGRIELNDFDAWLKMQSKPEGLTDHRQG